MALEENIAKNLFIRNDKKQNYYLLTIAGGKRADLKKVRNFLGERPLKFASEEDLDKIMGLKKGSVTPFGILNDSESKVKVLMDRAYRGKIIGVHPNDNTATVWLKTEDLMNIIISRGNEAEYIEI
ncbi:MAG: YbaK/EbsC family protein [Anaerovoracaceae bacterium]